jgi:NAD(P)-dependent dehydrogenase (short-subunit alcohol dehydrogenase family)
VGPLGVRVNAVEASLTETGNNVVVPDHQREDLINWIPLRRIGKPMDVAGAVTFLASDLSSFVNGATIPVNGGQLMY